MKRIITLLVCLFVCSVCLAQGTRYDNIALLDTGRPAGGATVRVCSSGSTGTPCTPLATIYSDVGVTTTKADPFTADAHGNYSFYAACGRYDIQISGSGLTTFTMPNVQIGPGNGANCALSVGAVNPTSLDSVLKCAQQAGATMDAKITACIAALPTNGGVADARGFGATSQTWAANVAVGSMTRFVTLLLDRSTKITPTISNGTSYMIDLAPGSAVIAEGDTQPQSNLGGIVMTSSTNMAGVLRLVNQGTGAGYTVRGTTVSCSSTPVITGAVFLLTNALQIGNFDRNNVTCALSGKLLEVTQSVGNPVGPISFYNDNMDCQAFTGNCTPVLVQAAASGGAMYGVSFYGGSYVHPGTTSHNIFDLEGITGNDCAGVNLFGVQLEARHATDVGVNINNCTNVHISGLIATANVTTGADLVKISGANTDNVTVDSAGDISIWTNMVNNTVNGKTYPSSTANRINYHYSGAGKANANVWDNGSGNLMKVDTNNVTTPDGSAVSPGVRVTTEASGMYRGGAGLLDFSVAGTQRFEIGAGSANLKGDANPVLKFGSTVFSGLTGLATAKIGCGNGTAGDTSCTFQSKENDVARIVSVGTAPTCSVTGAGSTGSCLVGGGSTDSNGLLQISATGTGPAATGTITITFSSSLGASSANCLMLPANTAAAWNARASFMQTSALNTSASQTWDNNAVALVATNNYQINYYCFGR